MTMRVTITRAGRTDTYGLPFLPNSTYTVTDDYGLDLIQQGYATDTDSVLAYLPNNPLQQGDALPLRADYTLQASDDQKVYFCTTALTVTIPVNLSPAPAVIFMPPASGTLSIASSGGTLLNGATTTLTRLRANNLIGVAIAPYQPLSTSYGVSGS